MNSETNFEKNLCLEYYSLWQNYALICKQQHASVVGPPHKQSHSSVHQSITRGSILCRLLRHENDGPDPIFWDACWEIFIRNEVLPQFQLAPTLLVMLLSMI
jgi:hypothetical protein